MVLKTDIMLQASKRYRMKPSAY